MAEQRVPHHNSAPSTMAAVGRPGLPPAAPHRDVPAWVGRQPDDSLPRGCSGSADGDLEIRPSRRRILVGTLCGILVLVYVWARSGSTDQTAMLAVMVLLVWAVWSSCTMVARLRVVGDVLELRTVGRRAVVPLDELDRSVSTYYTNMCRLHLRRRGGRHLATLSDVIWSRDSMRLLGKRLGAIDVRRQGVIGVRALERDFPGSLSRLGRHPVLVLLGSVSAVVLAYPAVVALLDVL